MSSFERDTGFDRMFVYVMLVGLTVDRISKLAAQAALRDQPAQTVVPGFLDLHYVENNGGVFGLLDHLPVFVRVIVSRVVPGLLAIALGVAYVKTPKTLDALRAALVLMLTGTVANMIDREKHGGVIDFINLRLGEYSPWLTINLADLYIVVGALLLALHLSSLSSASENP